MLVERVREARQVEVEVVREYERLLKEEEHPKAPTPATPATPASSRTPIKRTADAASLDEPPAKRPAVQLIVMPDD